MNIRIFESAEALAAELAARIRRSMETVGESGAVMLAGGRTPLAAYRRLADSPPAEGCGGHVFLSDERMAPSDSADSNVFHIGPLLHSAGISGDRFLRVDTAGTLDAAAEGYGRLLAEMVDEGIRIPFGILGVGADGHTASLFSRADVDAARKSGRLAVPVRRAEPPDRISTTPDLLARVEDLVFVITGADKARVIQTLLSEPESIPAGLAVEGHPGVSLWADRAAFPEHF